jgi:DNA-binding response OmpR family regulator
MSSPRLLMIDDEPSMGTLVGRVAEELGYQMFFVTRADAFMETHRSFAPDVIVLDLTMPDTDGFELLNFLVQERSRAQILILSGFHEGIRAGAKLLGEGRGLFMAGTISKPVRVSELRTILEGLKTKQTQPDR